MRCFVLFCFVSDKEQYRYGALSRWRFDNFGVLGRFICKETINFVASTVFRTFSSINVFFLPYNNIDISNPVFDFGLHFLGQKGYLEL